jgi:hypothetical protein
MQDKTMLNALKTIWRKFIEILGGGGPRPKPPQ